MPLRVSSCKSGVCDWLHCKSARLPRNLGGGLSGGGRHARRLGRAGRPAAWGFPRNWHSFGERFCSCWRSPGVCTPPLCRPTTEPKWGRDPHIYALLAPHRPVEYKVSAKAWATSGAPATPHRFLALRRPAPAPRSALEHQPASNWIAGWAFTHTAHPPPPCRRRRRLTPLAACPNRVTNSSCSHERVAVCHPGKPVLQKRVGSHLAALRLWRAAAVQPRLGAGGGLWLLLARRLRQAGVGSRGAEGT